MLRLSVLALRRTLPPWLLAGLVVLLLLAAQGARAAPLVAGDARALAEVRALARQNVWSVLFALAPLLVFQAARLGTPAANAWLAPASATRLARALALALGCALACALATAAAALASEAAVASSERAWRRARTLESPLAVLFDGQPSVSWSVPATAPGEHLRLATTIAIGAGPAATARFHARAGERSSAVEARVAGRTLLVLAPPAPAERLELELERVESGALLVLPPDALEVLAPAASERLAALTLGARVWLLLATACVLAFGLASALRPALASGLVLALVLSSWTSPLAARCVPGADLPRAWGELAGGLVPSGAPIAALPVALGLVALALALHASAPRARSAHARDGSA